jgi:sensor domain CHASE-containing protein
VTTSDFQPTERTSRLERLIVLAGILCAVVIIGATLSHSLQLRDEMRLDAQDRVKTVSRILTQEVNRSLMRTRGLLEQVDELTGGPMAIESADFTSRLDAMTRQHFLLREVAIVDSNGRIVAQHRPRCLGL